jgi:hypothetical protein
LAHDFSLAQRHSRPCDAGRRGVPLSRSPCPRRVWWRDCWQRPGRRGAIPAAVKAQVRVGLPAVHEESSRGSPRRPDNSAVGEVELGGDIHWWWQQGGGRRRRRRPLQLVEREGGVRSSSILRKRGSQLELTVEGNNGGARGVHRIREAVAPVAAGSRGERGPH